MRRRKMDMVVSVFGIYLAMGWAFNLGVLAGLTPTAREPGKPPSTILAATWRTGVVVVIWPVMAYCWIDENLKKNRELNKSP